jgi:hypothetical protein
VGSAYTGAPVSLVVQGEGNRLCTGGGGAPSGAPSSCECLETGLEERSLEPRSDFRDRGSGV